MRPRVAQGVRHDPFGGWFLRRGGTDIGVEIEPNDPAESDRQVLEQALGDQTQLDVALIGGQFAAEVVAVLGRLAMRMLRAVAAADGVHVLHPEVVGVSADGVNGLLEADLDFEALMATSELCREITLSDLQRPAFPSVLRLQVKGNPA